MQIAPSSPVSASPLPLTTDDATERTCANCDAPMHGPYCGVCGQHALDGNRLTFKALWGEFRRRFLHLEHGLLLTLRHMTFKPGHVIGRYLRGERKRYVNPLGFVVMATAFNLVVHALTDYQDRMLEQLGSGTMNAGSTSRSLEEMLRTFTTWSMENSTYLTVVICLFIALFLRLFMGQKMRVAEGLVFGLFCYGQVTVIGALAELSYLVWPDALNSMNVEMMIDSGLLLVLVCAAAYQMFKTWGSVALAALSVVLGYVGYMVFLSVVMIGFVLATLLADGEQAWTLRDAAAQGRADVVSALIVGGGDPNFTTSRTLLQDAAQAGHVAVVDTLLARGADPDRIDGDGHTALTLAIRDDRFDVARSLVAAGASPMASEHVGDALRHALHRSQVTLALTILESGVDPNAASDSTGNTPLIEAATHDLPGAVRALLARGADPDAARANAEAYTPLHEAIEGDYLEVASLLLEGGADPTTPTGDDRAPLQLADSDPMRALIQSALNKRRAQ